MLVKKWWDIYNDASLDYKPLMNASEAPAADGVDIEQFVQALSEVGHVQYVTAPSAA